MAYINKTITTTKCITDSIFYTLKRSADDDDDGLTVLVAASTSHLLVYNASGNEGLVEIGSVEVNGRVLGMEIMRFDKHDSILLTLDHPAAQLVVLTLSLINDKLTHNVECSKMLTHHINTSDPSHEYCNTVVDHTSQIGVSHLWQGQLHAFKLSYDHRRNTHIIDGRNSQIEYSVTLAAAFVAVDKDEHPTLCRLIMSPDVDNPVLVFEHVVDSDDYVDVSPSSLRIETQCPSAKLIVAVPGRKRAVLVIGAFNCEYYEVTKKDLNKHKNAKTGRRKSSLGGTTTTMASAIIDKDHLTVKTPFATPTACTSVTDDGMAWVISDERGDIYYLEIQASRIEVQLIGTSSAASTLQHLGNGYLYLGSQSEDSKLLVIQSNQLTELHNYINLAPLSDFVITHPDNVQGQLVVCSGSNRSGKLRVVTTGIGVKELYTVALPDYVQRIWSAQGYIIVSYPTNTRVYDRPNAMYGTFEETDALPELSRDTPTLDVKVSGDVVSVYQSTGIYTFDKDVLLHKKEMDIDSVYADAETGCAVVSAVDGLYLQKGSEHRTLTKPENSTKYALLDADHLVYTTWTDYSVNVVDTRNGELVYTHASPDSSPVSSLLTHGGVLVGGTANGHVFAFTLDAQYQCTELHTVAVGSTPVTLQRTDSGVLFALCDAPSIITVEDGRLYYAAVNARHINAVASYKEKGEEVYAMVHHDVLKFGKLLSTQHSVHIRSIDLGADIPRSIAYHDHDDGLYAVGCLQHAYRDDRTSYEQASNVKLLDNTFNTVNTFYLEEKEIVSFVNSLTLNKTPFIAIGTYYQPEEGEECTKGRFLLATVREGAVSVIAQLSTPGCVYDACTVHHDKIAIAVNYQVRVYSLEEAQQQYTLSLLAAYGNAFVVVSLSAMNGILVAADFLKSAIYLKLNEAHDKAKLELVGYDANTRWSSLVEALPSDDPHSFVTLGADISFNLFVLHYARNSQQDKHSVISQEITQLHENVSAIRHGRLSNVDVKRNVHPLAVYGTSAGTLSVLAQVDEETALQYIQMQKAIEERGDAIGQRVKHTTKKRSDGASNAAAAASSSSSSSHLSTTSSSSSHLIIDGDLIAKYHMVEDLQRLL